MFSESRNDRRPPIASGIATTPQGLAITPQKSAMGRRDRRYHRERDPMLNSILNGDWSNSVPGRQIPEGHLRSYTNSAFADIAGNSAPILPVTLRDRRRRRAERQRLRIERPYRRIE